MKIRYCLIGILCFVCLNTFATHALEPEYCEDIRGLSVSWDAGLNNSVRVIDFDGSVKYFKECKKKLNEEDEIRRIINEYFDEYLNEDFSDDKQLLTETIFEDGNLNKFTQAGYLWNINSNLSKYIRGEISADSLGINDSIAKKLKISLKDFLLYSSRELVQRCVSYDIEEGDLQTNLATKQLATYRLSKLFGIDDLVVKSDFVKLITNHGDKLGVLADKASGVTVDRIQKMNLVVDPKFQRDITSLQVLDTITNEQDHNPGNCCFEIKNGILIGVEAFDNEGAFGLNTDFQKGLCWNVTSPLVTKENKINLPHISESLAKKILSTTDDEIKDVLKDLLSDSQIDSCIKRFNGVKAALINTISKNDDFLLTDEKWSHDTLLKETSGKYGNTYLNHFLKKLNISVK